MEDRKRQGKLMEAGPGREKIDGLPRGMNNLEMRVIYSRNQETTEG